VTVWPDEAIIFRAVPGRFLDAVAFKPTLLYVFAEDRAHAVTTIHVLAEVFARRYAD
jgi:hypothetical protein